MKPIVLMEWGNYRAVRNCLGNVIVEKRMADSMGADSWTYYKEFSTSEPSISAFGELLTQLAAIAAGNPGTVSVCGWNVGCSVARSVQPFAYGRDSESEEIARLSINKKA